MAYDVKELRKEFPAINQTLDGKPLVYLDSACTTAICQAAIDAQLRYYTKFPGCVGRADHRFGRLATKAWNDARQGVASFLNASSPREVVFTKNTTEALNLVADAFPFKKGDVVLISDCEHNSNTLPWRRLGRRGTVRFVTARCRDDTTFDLESFSSQLSEERPRLVSVLHKSNLTGVEFPIEEVIRMAHEHGAVVVVDAAQSPMTSELDVQALDCDFLAFSSHKALGPCGVGVLYGKLHLLEQLDKFLIGGGTVEQLWDKDGPVFLGVPEQLEAGLQNAAGVMGLSAALKLIKSVGQENIRQHIETLNEFTTNRLLDIPGLSIMGPANPKDRGVMISFRLESMEAKRIGKRLNEEANVMVRAGKHCVGLWFSTRGGDDVARASFGPYNTLEECEIFCTAMEAIAG
ncbi:MAG: aminotransferase class V-fold PLP-dependent enzyme [Candidatus Coatesbacteria bacterium]|nr:aminotransferase class V-fold PLP-dependent enzyme [Candidatus Coatesbacteria bacterium]